MDIITTAGTLDMDLDSLYKANHAISHEAALQSVYQCGYEAGIRDSNVPVEMVSAVVAVDHQPQESEPESPAVEIPAAVPDPVVVPDEPVEEIQDQPEVVDVIKNEVTKTEEKEGAVK